MFENVVNPIGKLPRVEGVLAKQAEAERKRQELAEQQAKEERLNNPYSPGRELRSSPIDTSELKEINDVMRSIDLKMGTYKP